MNAGSGIGAPGERAFWGQPGVFRCPIAFTSPPLLARPPAHTPDERMWGQRRSSKGSRLALTLATTYTAAAFAYLLVQRSTREAPPAEADSAAAAGAASDK